MATTTSNGQVRTAAPVVAPGVVVHRRRLVGRLVGGALLVAAAGLGTAWLVAASADRTQVVVLVHDVPFGTALSEADLAVTAVSVDPTVATVPAQDLASVVGLVATSDLHAGQLLSSAMATTAVPPGPGQALVGLPVDSSAMPAGGLAAGQPIQVVDAPAPGADPPSTAPRVFAATVVRVGEPDLNGQRVVDVVTSEADAREVAVRAATGRFALVVLPLEAAS